MFDLPLSAADSPVALWPLMRDSLHHWLQGVGAAYRPWVEAHHYMAEAGAILPLPAIGTPNGGLAGMLVGMPNSNDLFALADLPQRLPPLSYQLICDGPYALDASAQTRLALGWTLGSYRFPQYQKSDQQKPLARLLWSKDCERGEVASLAEAVAMARDLINTPANDLGPAELAIAAKQLAAEFEGRVFILKGQDLVIAGYPAIFAVGAGSAREPHLIDFTWGDPEAPRVTLIGKGVVFDSGGLDLKPSPAMRLMKKDMGGAAIALALARLIMANNLPVRLRVLIPAVENSPSGSAYRPGDIIQTRKGLNVEIGNTDAEGRLILADALTEADREMPALLLDFATLTGAARVALGPDLPALFTNNDRLAEDFLSAGHLEQDPLWRLPLWAPYAKAMKGKISDLNNDGDMSTAGAITAALFLENFISPATPWAHIDTFAWNSSARPGRPEGGEAQSLRAAYRLLRQRFGR
jgi:leucyl aminopeptidase